MKYKCPKCGEIYNEMPMECDYDDSTEFKEVAICENCGEYEVLYGDYCEYCIRELFTEKIGFDYIKKLDERRKEWGLEPFFEAEYSFLKNKAVNNKNFLWEYCSKDLAGLGKFIFRNRGEI